MKKRSVTLLEFPDRLPFIAILNDDEVVPKVVYESPYFKTLNAAALCVDTFKDQAPKKTN